MIGKRAHRCRFRDIPARSRDTTSIVLCLATGALVRRPAIRARHGRSIPISAPRPRPVARPSSMSRVVIAGVRPGWIRVCVATGGR